jgi:hypothetical protein
MTPNLPLGALFTDSAEHPGREATWSFGRAPLDGARLNHTFFLRNWGAGPVVVTNLATSCGCTHASISVGNDSTLPLIVPAGAVASVSATIDPGVVGPGEFEKMLSVFVNSDAEPAVLLHLSGYLAEPIPVRPSELDFGSVPIGKQRSLLVAVSPLGHASLSGSLRLVSSSPVIRVKPVLPQPGSDSQQGQARQDAVAGEATLFYLVTFRPVTVGAVRGVLQLVGAEDAGSQQVPTSVPYAATVPELHKPIAGEANGTRVPGDKESHTRG